MASQLSENEHVARIQAAQASLIMRIQNAANEAFATIESDDPQAIEQHLEKLGLHSLTWDRESEQFFSTIAYALEQLGLKPAS